MSMFKTVATALQFKRLKAEYPGQMKDLSSKSPWHWKMRLCSLQIEDIKDSLRLTAE